MCRNRTQEAPQECCFILYVVHLLCAVDGLCVVPPLLQITVWLQCLFLFSLVWTLGGTMTGESRKKFDTFFRTLVSGSDAENPKPKSIKLTKVQPISPTTFDVAFSL